MIGKPKVSVCVVTYNQKDYIAECLQSIVSQNTNFTFEVIVGDDASTDGTSNIVMDFACRYPDLIKPIIHHKNIGPFENYRYIHGLARAEYVAHIDGDDYWLPGKLLKQKIYLEKNEGASSVFSNAIVININNNIIGVFCDAPKYTIDKTLLIKKNNFLNHSSMMYRKKNQLETDGKFIDFQLYIGLANNGFIGFIDEPLVAYRKGVSGSLISEYPEFIVDRTWDILKDRLSTSKVDALIGMGNYWPIIAMTMLTRSQPLRFLSWQIKLISDCGVLSVFVLCIGLFKSLSILTERCVFFLLKVLGCKFIRVLRK